MDKYRRKERWRPLPAGDWEFTWRDICILLEKIMTSCRRYNMQNREFFVLKELTKREKKRMSSETKLGQLWVFVDPLLHMAISEPFLR